MNTYIYRPGGRRKIAVHCRRRSGKWLLSSFAAI